MSEYIKNKETKLTPSAILYFVKTSGIFPILCFLIALLVNGLFVFIVPIEKWLQEFELMGMLSAVGHIIPSIRKIGELSDYPILFQFVFLLGILVAPIMVVLFIKFGNFKLDKALKKKPSAIFLILVGLVGSPLYLLVYIPGDPLGVGINAGIARSILYSKIGFIWWVSFMTFATTIFLSLSLALIHKWTTR